MTWLYITHQMKIFGTLSVFQTGRYRNHSTPNQRPWKLGATANYFGNSPILYYGETDEKQNERLHPIPTKRTAY